MDSSQVPPTAGVASALLVLIVLVLPVVLVEGGSGLGTYYGAGAVNGLGVGLFAVVSLVVFAAGREGRSAPDLVAGVALVLGAFAVGLAAVWATTVPDSVVLQLGTATSMQYHRWVVVLATLGLPVSAGWYARRLGLL